MKGMSDAKAADYRARLRRQNGILWVLLALSVVYILLMSEFLPRVIEVLDSRTWTQDMLSMQKVLFIWQGYAIWRIVHNRNLIRDALRMRDDMVKSEDERIAAIKGMAGRRLAFILCVLLSIAAITATFIDVVIFYTLYVTLLCALALWGILYLYYRRKL